MNPRLLLLGLLLFGIGCGTAPDAAYERHLRDSLIVALRDSFALVTIDSSELANEIAQHRLVLEYPSYEGQDQQPHWVSTWAAQSLLLQSPDLNSPVIDTLPLGTPLNIPYRDIDNYWALSGEHRLQKVATQDSTVGYLKRNSYGSYRFDHSLQEGITFIAGLCPEKGVQNCLRIIKIEVNKAKILETFTLQYPKDQSFSGIYQIQYVPNLALEHVDFALHWETTNDFCGGTLRDHYIAEVQGKLKNLLTTASNGDAG